jgi:hypothetical protein
MKREMARAARATAMVTNMAMVTNGDNSWWAFDGGNDGDGAKDKATRATIGERGVMVAVGHGLYMCFGVCRETTKNKEESKIVNDSYSSIRLKS